MINYKVNVDLGNNFTKQNLAKYDLGKYKVPFCTIFVQDKNPDGAAGKVLTNLIFMPIIKSHIDASSDNFRSNYEHNKQLSIETIDNIEFVSTRSSLLASALSATNFCCDSVLIPKVAICICNSFISADCASNALLAGST